MAIAEHSLDDREPLVNERSMVTFHLSLTSCSKMKPRGTQDQLDQHVLFPGFLAFFLWPFFEGIRWNVETYLYWISEDL